MPCGGCAKRRKALLDAWQRLREKSLMLNGSRRPPTNPKSKVKSRKQGQPLSSWARLANRDDVQ